MACDRAGTKYAAVGVKETSFNKGQSRALKKTSRRPLFLIKLQFHYSPRAKMFRHFAAIFKQKRNRHYEERDLPLGNPHAVQGVLNKFLNPPLRRRPKLSAKFSKRISAINAASKKLSRHTPFPGKPQGRILQ